MTTLNVSQMREVDGAGFFDAFVCGAIVGTLIWVAVTPEPVSKLALGTLWTTAIGSCGSAVT